MADNDDTAAEPAANEAVADPVKLEELAPPPAVMLISPDTMEDLLFDMRNQWTDAQDAHNVLWLATHGIVLNAVGVLNERNDAGEQEEPQDGSGAEPPEPQE